MRTLGCVAALVLLPAVASAGVALGADGEAVFSVGHGVDGGSGGGGVVRLGFATPMLGLGPMGLQLIPEATGSYHVLRQVGSTASMVRVTGGARLALTLVWIRKPKEEEDHSSTRGVRLTATGFVHGGAGVPDLDAGWAGTVDGGVALGLGLGPIEIAAHVDVGGIGDADPTVLEGRVWIGVGGGLSAQF